VSVLQEAWATLREVAAIIDKVSDLSDEVKALRAENRDLRDRIIRIETIVDEARRHTAARALPPKRK
jgi:regulator of replication initiation timing